MFSASQLAKMAKKLRISQETFDEAVKQNVEDFEMEPDEALQSAIEEFEAQGVDLSNIIKTLAGGDLSTLAGAQAVTELNAQLDAGVIPGIAAALQHLQALTEDAAPGSSAELLAVLDKAGAVGAAVSALTSQQSSTEVVLPALRLLAMLLASRSHQAAFRQADGASVVACLLSRHAEGEGVVAAALAAAAAAATQSEDNKAAAMDCGLATGSLRALQQHEGSTDVVCAAAALLSAVTSADDETQPSSRAFANARALAKDGAATQLVHVLRQHEGQEAAATIAACGALRQVAANDDICQEVTAAGGAHLTLAILQARQADVPVACAATALLRQLASSDGSKALIVEAGGLEQIKGLLSVHASSSAVAEQALGLLTNLTLRNPEASTRAVECGCSDAVLSTMQGLLDSKENRAPAAERQGCMACRNIVSRCPELRPLLLERGAESLLRRIKRTYPACQDAASAALRDLGLDNYNA